MRQNPNLVSLPLISRMVTRLPEVPKAGIEETYRRVLNRLRRYNGASIAELALKMLWNPPTGRIEELRSAPWLTLLLVKWAIKDNLVSLRSGPSIPAAEFDNLRQVLWELQGRSHENQPNVELMIRNLIHVQLEFQRKESWEFLRWPALYYQLSSGSTNRKQFREVMGMEPEAFIDMAHGLYAGVVGATVPLGKDYLSSFRPTYSDSVDQMYRLFVRDLHSLREELQSEDAQRIQGKQELFEFPYLRRFPFLRLQDGRIHCWHPLVFARGMEDAVHLRLSRLGATYTNEFSRVFEKYVTELAAETGQTMLDESTYKAKQGGHAPAVEVIVQGEDCNILIEAKMSLFADDVLLQDSEVAIFQKTKRVRDAIKQAWKVSEIIRDPSSGYETRFQTRQDYLLVVTSRELNIGNGGRLQRMYAPGQLNYPNAVAEKNLPLTNVFILSIEDFERLMGCVAAGEINLSAILREAVTANENGATARMFFSDFLGKYTKRWAIPSVIQNARQAADARIKAALGVS